MQDEIDKGLDQMVSQFGLEDDDNINMIRKVSQVMSSQKLERPLLNTSKIIGNKSEIKDNDSSFFKSKNPNVNNVSRNEGLFLKDLSKIELGLEDSGMLISTDRNGFLKTNGLMVLRGKAETRLIDP